MAKLLIVLSFSLFMLMGGDKSIEKKLNKVLRKSFGTEHVVREPLKIDIDHERPEPGLQLFSLSGRSGLLGYMIVTAAKGRYDYFDYSVLYDPDLRIRHIEILTYRSDHGYEIASRKWLGQFRGKDGCDLAYGVDIDAIGGATLSASSITSDIGFLCRLMRSLH